MKLATLSQLEKTMVRYRDLTRIPVTDSREPMMTLSPTVVRNGYRVEMSDMVPMLGDKIVVRKTLIALLTTAQRLLRKKNKKYSLFITYGFRSLDVQTRKFQLVASQIAKKRFFKNPTDLYEEVHRFIAVPTVAGHPTGGAVDVIIIDTTGKELDFGSPQYDFNTKNCYVFAPNISAPARQNRRLLRCCMTAAGFAPFDGEWWHFSYGDREWACYYKKAKAIYSQRKISQVKSNLLQCKL